MIFFVIACLAADPKSRFMTDYQSELSNLKSEFVEARGDATLRTVKDGKLGSPTTYRFANGQGRQKFEFEKTVWMDSGKSSVNRYGYAEIDGRNIEVHRTGPSEPYKIRGIGDADPVRRSVFNAAFGNYLNAPWSVSGFDIGEAVAQGWFSITEARAVEERGRELIEVTFRLTTMAQPHHYQAAFDPSLHWAIARASRWKADPSKPSERYEAGYGPTASGRPYLRTVRWWDLDGKEILCEFGKVEFATTPASEFTLEYYGLKSPPLPDRGPNYKLSSAIVALTVALLFGAWLMRRLAMRRDGTDPKVERWK